MENVSTGVLDKNKDKERYFSVLYDLSRIEIILVPIFYLRFSLFQSADIEKQYSLYFFVSRSSPEAN